MNQADTLAEAYIQTFWPEKPEPMKQMIRMAYTAGYNGFRGQVAAMALQGMLANDNVLKPQIEREYFTKTAIALADSLISKLNKK